MQLRRDQHRCSTRAVSWADRGTQGDMRRAGCHWRGRAVGGRSCRSASSVRASRDKDTPPGTPTTGLAHIQQLSSAGLWEALDTSPGETGVRSADLIIGATGRDDDNLVVSPPAKRQFAVPGSQPGQRWRKHLDVHCPLGCGHPCRRHSARLPPMCAFTVLSPLCVCVRLPTVPRRGPPAHGAKRLKGSPYGPRPESGPLGPTPQAERLSSTAPAPALLKVTRRTWRRGVAE